MLEQCREAGEEEVLCKQKSSPNFIQVSSGYKAIGKMFLSNALTRHQRDGKEGACKSQ